MIGAVVLASMTAAARSVSAQEFDQVSFNLPGIPSAMHWYDLDGDGRKELLTSDLDRVTLFRPLAGDAPGRVWQTVDEGGSGFLFDLADLDGDGRTELVIARALGVVALRFTKEGRFSRSERPAVRIRRSYTPARPLRVRMVRDLDGDGALDLVYPAGGRFRLFPGDGSGGFDARRICTLPSGIRIVVKAPTDVLDAQLESTFRIPKLLARDVDGDGHPDLIAQLGRRLDIYQGGAGWTFSDRPKWVLDLARFAASTSEEEDDRKVKVELGGVNLSQDDLDGDGVRDFLIAAGRKVWVFFGGKGFEGFNRPDRILRVGQDIAAVFTGDVDGDGLPDLILVKFEMPGVARLVAALLVGIDLRIVALAYRNHGDRSISKKPDRSNRITFSVPPILSMLSEIDRLEKKVREARKQADRLRVGDLTGNGIYDVGVREGNRLDLYESRGEGAVAGGIHSREVINRVIRDLLFDPTRNQWDIDRLMDYVGDLRYSLNRDQIEGRPPMATLKLRKGPFRRTNFQFVELNGDDKGDVVVTYDRDGVRIVDLYLSK
jgi:hypothetical protein